MKLPKALLLVLLLSFLAVRADAQPQQAAAPKDDLFRTIASLDGEVFDAFNRCDLEWFDPNIDLVFRNYFENKVHFLGIGNCTEEGFAQMARAVPLTLVMFKQALQTPGLKVIFGTDAVAGSHGRNFEELIYRVKQGGQDPMAAIVSATSLAAESLRLQDRIGTAAPGYEADLIAVDGDPLQDIGALKRVVFVMKGGQVLKNAGKGGL